MTKKDTLLALCQAETVTATVHGGLTLDEWPALVEQRVKEGWTHVPGKRIELGPRFVVRPGIHRVRQGVFRAKGVKYTFMWLEGGQMRDSQGRTPELNEVDGALELTMFNGAVIRYTVANTEPGNTN
jgi:hypothetical protein